MSIWKQSYLVFTWKLANSSESIREFSHQVISEFNALGTLVILLQVVLPLLLPEWVLCLLGFCWAEWSQQHSSLGPQLTCHMLGDPREQDQVCLQHISMSGSCVVGLQECLVARGWGYRGFHTGESETHCRQLAWFVWGPGQWAGHLGWFVSDVAVGADGGVVCYLQIQCQSWHRLRQCLYCWHLQAVLWLCMLHCTAGNWCCWWWCTSPTVLQSIAAMNRSLCGGLFSVFDFGSLWFSPLFMTFEPGLMMGCLWTSGARAVAFCFPVTLFHNLYMLSLKQGSCVYWGVLVGAVGAQCIWCLQLWIMCLAGVAYSMYCMTHTHCSCSWFHSIVCSADQMRYLLVMANLQKLLVQLDVGIWDHPNQPALNFESYGSITAITDLCPAGKLAYLIY